MKKTKQISMVLTLLLLFQFIFPVLKAWGATDNGSILPPSNLASQLLTPSDVKLTWSPVFGATGYNVYSITNGQLINVGTTTTASYAINNLPEGSYSYVVSTLSSGGESGPCAPVNVNITYPAMTAPASLTYNIQNGNNIVLNWGTAPYVQTYNLYENQESGRKLVYSGTARTFTVNNSAEGIYTYTVTASNSLYGESPDSTPVNVTVVYPAMAAPSGLTYTVATDDVTLKWNAATYATGYNVYQISDNQKVLISSKITGTAVTYMNLPVGTYTYEVHSFSDRFGESVAGSTISLTLGTIVPPSNLTFKLQNANDVVLTWSAATNATSYKVYQVINGEKVLKNTVTSTTVTFTNMPAGDYVYEVHSNSSVFGESVDGSTVSLTVGTVTMVPPSTFTSKLQNLTDIVLTWTVAPNATSYNIYQVIGDQKVLKSTVTGTTVTYLNLPAGDYVYEIHSVSSRFGESAEGIQTALTVGEVVMSAPGNFAYKIQNANDIVLTWTVAPNATAYKVYQIVDGQKVLKSTVSGTTVTYTNLAAGDYTYEIHSNSTRYGESVDGAQVTFSIVLPEILPPTNLVQSVTSATAFSLNWYAAAYANSYKVYQIVNGQKVLKSTVTTTTVSYTNMAPGDYTYEVHTVSTRFGESVEGVQLTFTMNGQIMQAPASLTYSLANVNDLTLKWTSAPNATSYKVYQVINGQKVLKSTLTGLTVTYTNLPSGDYLYVVDSYSTILGESPGGAEVSFNITLPTMVGPDNLTAKVQNGNDVVLTWNTVPNANSYKVYELVNGAEVLKSTATTLTATYTNVTAGDHTYVVHSLSTKFGESPEGSEVSLSIVFPVMQAPGNVSKSVTNGNDITLRWGSVTYTTAYRVYQIVNGQRVFKNTVTGTSATFTNMPEGDYDYEIYSYSDRFGESPMPGISTFTLTWPVLQSSQLKGTVTNANNLTLTWTAATWANEYRVYEVTGGTRQLIYKGTALTTQIYNLSEKTHNYQLTIYNTRFGESSPSNQLIEDIIYPDMQSPAASLRLLSPTSAVITWNFVTYANGYNVYEIVNGQPVPLVNNLNNLSYTLNNLSYANHLYYVSSYSNSFGESVPSNTVEAKLIVDTEAPVTTATAPTDWTNQSAAVTLSATDNETGVANTFYSLNDQAFVSGTTVAVSQECMNKVSFYSVDKVGNTEATKTVYVKIDKTAPITKASDVQGWSKEATVTLAATDDQSGVAKTLYSVNGGDYTEGTSVTVTQEGVSQVSFYSVDQAGNTEKAQTVEVKIDHTAPVTNATAPNGWTKSDATVTLAAADSQSGVAKTFYSVNGGEYAEGTSVIVSQEGVSQVSFYSVDQAGNTEKAQTVEVRIDRTPPEITMNLSNEYKLNTMLTLSYSASDILSGIVSDSMTITEPGESVGKTISNGSTINLDKPGIYTILVNARNAAGLSTTIHKQFVVYIAATIEVTPTVIKGNNGVFTVRVNLPEGFKSDGFDLNKATLNGVKALSSNNGYFNQAKNGQFKFERSDFTWTGTIENLEFRGYVNGFLVVGQTTVKVQK
jgi:fibronectin type 3 domain-containing protein